MTVICDSCAQCNILHISAVDPGLTTKSANLVKASSA